MHQTRAFLLHTTGRYTDVMTVADLEHMLSWGDMLAQVEREASRRLDRYLDQASADTQQTPAPK